MPPVCPVQLPTVRRPRLLQAGWWGRWPQDGWGSCWLLLVLLLVLVGAAAPVAAQTAAPLGRVRAVLTGQEVLPDPGAADAQARATVDLHNDQVCWDVSWAGVAPVAAHLHRGSAGEVGPVAIGLFEVQTPLAGEDARQGCTGADPGLIAQISQQPAAYYVQLRSQQHPSGAARGQLAREGQLPHTGPELGLPSPVVQALLFGLIGGGLLLLPLVRRSQARER